MQDGRDVGGAHRVETGNERLGGLVGRGQGKPADLGPVDDEPLAPAESAAAPADEELGDEPVGRSALLDRDV